MDCLLSAKRQGYCVCDWRKNWSRAKDMQEIQEVYQAHIARLQQYQKLGISQNRQKTKRSSNK
jgi:hypothetical protein